MNSNSINNHNLLIQINQKRIMIQSYPKMNTNFMNFKIIFTSQASNSSRTIDCYLPINPSTRQIELNSALSDANERGVPLKGCRLFHLDFSKRLNVFLGVFPFCQLKTVPLESVINNSIQISVQACSVPSGEMIQEIAQIQETPKNKKVKERTIQQAIDAVRSWRQYYDTPDSQTGRRLYTLDQAAKKVGIAKKTLDDYYNHLRVAQEFDFNIQRYSESKIGILRKFVKLAKEQGRDAVERDMPQCVIETNIEKYWGDLFV